MDKPPPMAPHREIELKLALLAGGPRRWPQAVARALQALATLPPERRELHSVYHDTPDGRLRSVRAALRLRRSDRDPGWIQTLKVADRPAALVDNRREWELRVPSGRPVRRGAPPEVWRNLDPDGTLFAALRPCFATRFRRTAWWVRDPAGGTVEVALDQGRIACGERIDALCELEFELKAGDPRQLLQLASVVSQQLATWPARASKAERGFRLAMAQTAAPVLASPPTLASGMPLAQAAADVLAEAYWQFADNLMQLRDQDAVEFAHQARIGWRRLRTAARLFADVATQSPPPTGALRPLLDALGDLRDIEVVRFEVLPDRLDRWVGRSARRGRLRDEALACLDRARADARAALRAAMEQPSCGAAMLDWATWIDHFGRIGAAAAVASIDGAWAEARLRRLRRRLDRAARKAGTDDDWHRVRILAKRLRYASEILATLIPPRRARTLRRHALDLQRGIGAGRDLAMAAQWLARLGVDRSIVRLAGSPADRDG